VPRIWTVPRTIACTRGVPAYHRGHGPPGRLTVAGPFISFLSDFGGETAPAICRGVIWSIAADARILDINHSIRRHSIRDGAFLLSRAIGYLPVGVHLAVVDPGVGTGRRAIAILASRGDILVGPDNGLLRPAARALGGIVEARELTNAELFLPRVSGTFHGRDIFAPVAARLAAGLPLTSVGAAVKAEALDRIDVPEPRRHRDGLTAIAVLVDRFGNVALNLRAHDLEKARLTETVELLTGDERYLAKVARTFSSVRASDIVVLIDSYGQASVAVSNGSAAEVLGLDAGDEIRLRRLG
jgi:S-adenosylmethionine hydrolase